LQHLITPFIAVKGVEPRSPGPEEVRLYDELEEVKRGAGFKRKAKLFIAETNIANAFTANNIFTENYCNSQTSKDSK
jgi:hypothetical protein